MDKRQLNPVLALFENKCKNHVGKLKVRESNKRRKFREGQNLFNYLGNKEEVIMKSW